MNTAHFPGKVACAFALALGLGSAAIAAPLPVLRHAPVPTHVHVRPGTTGTFSTLYNFSGPDGSSPVGNLDLVLGLYSNPVTRTLYGVTEGGGSGSSGTVFSYSLDSAAFSSVYAFTGGTDGSIPTAGLATNDTNYAVAGQTQLGVTVGGGAYDQGEVYSLASNGSIAVVHAFTGGKDGGSPAGRLTLFTDRNYYGTTSSGGKYGAGTVYRINGVTGTFSVVYSFQGGTDGASPAAGLSLNVSLIGTAARSPRGAAQLTPSMQRSASLAPAYIAAYMYGTTSGGGRYGAGTIFRVTPGGILHTIYSFTGGADGASPGAKLSTDYLGDLYGTTTGGGSAGNGVIFKLAQPTFGFQVVHDFGDGSSGAAPQAQITVAQNGNLYGTTAAGGASGVYGTVFELTPAGGFTDIHDFAGSDGANPQGAIVDGGDGNLYGSTLAGGTNGAGTLFAIAE